MVIRILLCALLALVFVGGLHFVENKLRPRSTKATKVKRRANEGPDSAAVEHEPDAD